MIRVIEASHDDMTTLITVACTEFHLVFQLVHIGFESSQEVVCHTKQ